VSIIAKEFSEISVENMKVQILNENEKRNEFTIKFLINEIDELRKHNDDGTVKTIIYNQLNNGDIVDNRYIWIDEVVDYNGGDNFAKVFVHQNLKQIENTYRSTSFEDKYGNRPLEMALEGVKENGSISYSYYFPTYDDKKIEFKYSYVELYQDYNWMIGCGIPESDLFNDIDAAAKVQSRIIIALSLLIVSVAVLMCIRIYDRKKKDEEAKKLKYEKISADAKSEAKTEFLSTISHELRTPLNAIMGLNDLLAQSIGNETQVKDYSNKIAESSQMLLSLINDVLDMSAIEKGKIKIAQDRFNIKTLVHGVTDIYYNLAVKKDLDFEVVADDLPHEMLIGDSYRIRQMILNLLSNALKFTDKGKLVLSVKEEKIRDYKLLLHITVEDTGCGIKPDALHRLFEQFEQEDASVVRKYGGSGLGLSITKHLTECMNGSIHVESDYGKGSSFTITIPLTIGVDDFKTVDQSKIGQKVLIIGNNNKHNQIFKDILSGWNVQYAETKVTLSSLDKFEEGLVNFKSFIIDEKLIPNLDGIELSKRIRKIKPTSIIIMMTGHNVIEIRKNNELDMNYLIQRPIIKKDLYTKLTKSFCEQNDGSKIKMVSSIKGKRVLLVDDNKINLLVASNLLKSFGLHVTVAQDGQNAVNLVKSSDLFDIILMDVRMPIMDGLSATKRIREFNTDLPIIALSANAFAADIKKSKEAGMNYHISKPIDKDNLLSILYKFIGDDSSII